MTRRTPLFAALFFAAITPSCGPTRPLAISEVNQSPDGTRSRGENKSVEEVVELLKLSYSRPRLSDLSRFLKISSLRRSATVASPSLFVIDARPNAYGVSSAEIYACGDGVNARTQVHVIKFNFTSAHQGPSCVDIHHLSERMGTVLEPPGPAASPGLKWTVSAIGRDGGRFIYINSDSRSFPCVTSVRIANGALQCTGSL
jgi:hypothetical protein